MEEKEKKKKRKKKRKKNNRQRGEELEGEGRHVDRRDFESKKNIRLEKY